jgi:hypothetical protein
MAGKFTVEVLLRTSPLWALTSQVIFAVLVSGDVPAAASVSVYVHVTGGVLAGMVVPTNA